jgi:ATP/maltotriose-dependent transcriptional regulator MalT/ActR/RegA family two-component response regulator
MTTKILLVDDHPLFRKGLRLLLEEQADFKIVGEAGDGREAFDQVRKLSPDVVIMDIGMPDLNGIDATRKIISENPAVKVVALSMHSGKRFVEDMLQAGAAGYILKKSVPEDIVNGIQAVSAGEIFLSPAITDIVVTEYKALLVKSPSTAEMEDTAPILSTKFNRPTLSSDHIPRTHLLARLDRNRHMSLFLVSAPAGYGKTLLVSSWLEAGAAPGAWAWVSLDENDNDLRTFMRYFLTAILSCPGTESFDADRETAAMANAVTIPPISVLAGKLINELNRIEEPFFLVLDDFHFIKNQTILDLITQVLHHSPKSMHLVLVCRRDPPLPISTLRVKGTVMEIRTRDLRFDTDEVASFLTKVFGKQVASSTVTALEKKTDGWATGLRLTALTMRQGKIDPKLLEPQADLQYIMEYLFDEVLAKQPPEITRYLMGIAILDRFNEALCEAVCPPGDDLSTCAFGGREFIDWLKQENLFVSALGPENRWFCFHPLFKKLLYSQMERCFSTREIDALHARASAWFVENDMIAEGQKHALARGNQATPLSIQPLVEPLTNREIEVLGLLVKRLSNKEIAAKMFISPETVKKHLNNLYGKLNANGRRQAVEKAGHLKII